MPKTLKNELKFKCCELACGKIIRGDKWQKHCKTDHGYKLSRGDEIKKRTIAVKRSGGTWEPSDDRIQVCVLVYMSLLSRVSVVTVVCMQSSKCGH